MMIQIRCREEKLYQFSLASASFLSHGFEVIDREETTHYFPYDNLIHVSMKKDSSPGPIGE